MSVRDSEAAAEASGVAIRRAKLVLWVIAGLADRTGGGCRPMNTLQVTPDAVFIELVGNGDLHRRARRHGTLEGPILGTLVYFLLRESFASYGSGGISLASVPLPSS